MKSRELSAIIERENTNVWTCRIVFMHQYLSDLSRYVNGDCRGADENENEIFHIEYSAKNTSPTRLVSEIASADLAMNKGMCIRSSPTGQFVAAGCRDGAVRVYRVPEASPAALPLVYTLPGDAPNAAQGHACSVQIPNTGHPPWQVTFTSLHARHLTH